MSANGRNRNSNGKTRSSGPVWLAAIVTLVALIAYGILLVILYQQVDSAEPAWSRKVLLLTGVEAVTFAAVGWLFGREVNRGAADAAKTANTQAQDNAAEAGVQRGRGAMLASGIRQAAADSTTAAELRGTTAARSQLDSLVAMANEFYPPGS
jgi:lysylphosphatidylglycerol synthetase-like protein (DUF2156 family)